MPLVSSHFNIDPTNYDKCNWSFSISGVGCSAIAFIDATNSLQISTSPNANCVSCNIDCNEYASVVNGQVDPTVYGIRSVPFTVAACMPSWTST